MGVWSGRGLGNGAGRPPGVPEGTDFNLEVGLDWIIWAAQAAEGRFWVRLWRFFDFLSFGLRRWVAGFFSSFVYYYFTFYSLLWVGFMTWHHKGNSMDEI